MSVDLSPGVVVARLRGHVVELVPIGIAGDLAMPLAVGRDLDGAWLVGESAATLAGQARGDILTQLVWPEENQSVAGLSVPTADLDVDGRRFGSKSSMSNQGDSRGDSRVRGVVGAGTHDMPGSMHAGTPARSSIVRLVASRLSTIAPLDRAAAT
jgi:hypothetical protein